MNQFSHKDIDGRYSKKIFTQDYSKKPPIDGVKIVEVRNITGEDGDFAELMRLDDKGQSQEFPGFYPKQISRSRMVPGTVKAWHIHYNQDDIWHVPSSEMLLIGLLDVRRDSPTKHLTMRLAVGNGKAYMVYIPHGVAHGAANLSKKPASIIYFVNQRFDIENPDEHRLPWDIAGKEFWEIIKG